MSFAYGQDGADLCHARMALHSSVQKVGAVLAKESQHWDFKAGP
jgi:hypothetical protein